MVLKKATLQKVGVTLASSRASGDYSPPSLCTTALIFIAKKIYNIVRGALQPSAIPLLYHVQKTTNSQT